MGRWTVTARRGAQSLGVYPITAEQTILDALDEANIRIPRSCTSGTCGTCMMSLLEGEIAPIDEISVSYTHLRAHETLRYLVCRLQLE